MVHKLCVPIAVTRWESGDRCAVKLHGPCHENHRAQLVWRSSKAKSQVGLWADNMGWSWRSRRRPPYRITANYILQENVSRSKRSDQTQSWAKKVVCDSFDPCRSRKQRWGHPYSPHQHRTCWNSCPGLQYAPEPTTLSRWHLDCCSLSAFCLYKWKGQRALKQVCRSRRSTRAYCEWGRKHLFSWLCWIDQTHVASNQWEHQGCLASRMALAWLLHIDTHRWCMCLGSGHVFLPTVLQVLPLFRQ
jgi:hypothetical protein